MIVKPIQYQTKWNSDDFLGKSHLSHVDKNEKAPIPGTQIRREQLNIQAKEYDRQRFSSSVEDSENSLQKRLDIKLQLATIKAAVQVETTIGVPLQKVEDVLAEKVVQNNPDLETNYPDSAKDIAKFSNNIALGRHMYVGFATVSGFNSINYQDSATGTSFLHTACRKGYPEVVGELLKYRAQPDVKNRIGNAPAHDCWMFWNNVAVGRPTSERVLQEEKTCQMLSHLMSYGGFVDIQDSRGFTPLHIACKMGPTKAVIILLGFKAQHHLLTKAGESCLDFAIKTGREDIIKIIGAWDKIKREMKKGDFTVLWSIFVKSSEAVITNQKSVAEILADFEMGERLKRIERGDQLFIPIDDSMLRLALKEKKYEVEENSPVKPWMKGWKQFAASVEKRKAQEREALLMKDYMEDESDMDHEAAAFNQRIRDEQLALEKIVRDRRRSSLRHSAKSMKQLNEHDDAVAAGDGDEEDDSDEDEEVDIWNTAAGRKKMENKTTIHQKEAPLPRRRNLPDMFHEITSMNRRVSQLTLQSGSGHARSDPNTPTIEPSLGNSQRGSRTPLTSPELISLNGSRRGSSTIRDRAAASLMKLDSGPPKGKTKKKEKKQERKSMDEVPTGKKTTSRLLDAVEQSEKDEEDGAHRDDNVEGEDEMEDMYNALGYNIKGDIQRRRINISECLKSDARSDLDLRRRGIESLIFHPQVIAREKEQQSMGDVYDRVFVARKLNLSELVEGQKNTDASMESYKVHPYPFNIPIFMVIQCIQTDWTPCLL